jgi:pyridoxine 5-phosphate synthase
MAKLSVNVNKVATLRNTRHLGIPSVVEASQVCLDAGRRHHRSPAPDQRHIRPADVYEIAELLKSYPGAEFNIEGNPFHEFLPLRRDVRPTQCTLVPDERDVRPATRGGT